MVVDLALEAAAEVERLRKARILIADAGAFVANGPIVGIARRAGVRERLGRRAVLLYRSAYEDAHGRIVHSMLVAVTIALGAGRIDVRHIDWSNPLLLSIVNDRCRAWRDSSRRIVAHFSSTRLARERAIRAAHTAAKQSFQPGLFDRRAARAHVAQERDAADLSACLAARMAHAASAGSIALRVPELLLVLIPTDAARV